MTTPLIFQTPEELRAFLSENAHLIAPLPEWAKELAQQSLWDYHHYGEKAQSPQALEKACKRIVALKGHAAIFYAAGIFELEDFEDRDEALSEAFERLTLAYPTSAYVWDKRIITFIGR